MRKPVRMDLRNNGWKQAICLVLITLAADHGRADAAEGAGKFLKRSDAWFAGEQARQVADNILSYQSDLGGWPKNVDTTAAKFTGDRQTLKPTFDNGATTDELRFLARRYAATKDERCRGSPARTGLHPQGPVSLGRLAAVLPAEQEVPSPHHLQRRRDGAANAIPARDLHDGGLCLFALRQSVRRPPRLRPGHRVHRQVPDSRERQGDRLVCRARREDYRPQPGRTYELINLSGAESVGIVRLVMSLDDPSPEVVQAVEDAVAWFEAAKLKGIRVVVKDDAKSPTGKDKVVVNDPAAPLMWARFYEIGTNQPIFADRDGVAKHNLAEIGYERRNGYTWLGYWPQRLLEREYPVWKQKWAGKP